MIQSRILNLGEWMPDRPDLNNSVTDALNVIPQAESYRQLNDLQPVAAAIDSRPFRAVVVKDAAGAVHNFVGDAGKLYKLSTDTYLDVSKASGYSAASWEMVKFGDRQIAVSLAAPTQYYDIGTSTLFADLPGSPPKAAHAAIVRDFVVFANLDVGGTQFPQRVQWSGFNNAEVWGVDAGTQADFQDLFGNGGPIQKIVPGEYAVIFQESSIWRMDYAGPPTIFRFDEVERGRGTLTPNAVTWYGNNIFYWGNDGFYVFNGEQSTPIGSEKVDRYIRGRYDSARANEFYGGIDRRNNLVLWTYPLLQGGTELIIFNIATGKWSRSDIQASIFTEYADGGFSLDDLDSLFADIDSASIEVDSPDYQGGLITMGAFNSSFRLSNFTGAAKEGIIETGEYNAGGGRKTFVQNARPLIEGGGTYTVALGSRAKQTDDITFGDYKSISSIGECLFHRTTRFPRFRIKLEGGFTHAAGVEVFYGDGGRI